MWVIRRTLKHLDGFCICTLHLVFCLGCVFVCYRLSLVTCHLSLVTLTRVQGRLGTPWTVTFTTAPLSYERAVTNQNSKDTPAFCMQVLDRHRKRHT